MNIDMYGFESYGTSSPPTKNTTFSMSPNGTQLGWGTVTLPTTSVSRSISNTNPIITPLGSATAYISNTNTGSGSSAVGSGIFYGAPRVPSSGQGGAYSLQFMAANNASFSVSNVTSYFQFPINTPHPSCGWYINIPSFTYAVATDICQIGGSTGLRLRWLGGTSFQVFLNTTSLGTFTASSMLANTWIYVGFDFIPGTSISFKVGLGVSGVLSTTYSTYNTNVTLGMNFYQAAFGAVYWLLDDIIYNDSGLDDGSGKNMAQPYVTGDCRVVWQPAPTLSAQAGATYTGATIPGSLIAAGDGSVVNVAAAGYANCTFGTIPTAGLADSVLAMKMFLQGVYNPSYINQHTFNFGTTIGGNTVSYGATTASASATNYCKVFNAPGTLTQFNAGATSNISCPS